MKPSSVFINIGRGVTVNEDDLILALQTKQIAGACLDVFAVEPLPKESPLWDMPNVLMYPHTACDDNNDLDRIMGLINMNI